MEEPGYNEPWRSHERDMRHRAGELEHALKRMERDLKHSERERMHAIKDAFKNEIKYSGMRREGGLRTVEEVLVEIDSYLSYLEDLPQERLAPYENKVDSLAEHLEKVRSSLKNRK